MHSLRSWALLAGALYVVLAALPSPAAEPATVARPGGAFATVRSVDDAIAMALEQSPILRAADERRGARRGDRLQAGLLPNPEVSVEGENFVGSGPYRGTRALETTLGVAQRLELGGKRSARVDVADAGTLLSERDYQAARLDLVRNVSVAYAETVFARRATEIARELLRVADDVLRVVSERVSGGKEPLVQARKAEVARSTAVVMADRARRDEEIARRALAILIGVDRIEVVPDSSWYENVGPDPAIARPLPGGAVAANPDYARWDAELARSRAGLTLEKATAVPDLTVGAGMRRFSDTNDSAVVLSLRIPIPVLNRNQGAIERAGRDLARTEYEAQQARLALEASLVDANRRLSTAWKEAEEFRRTIVPASEQAFDFAREGYSAGKFAFLEVLDAQRTLFDARARLNEALKEFHVRCAEVDRLTGQWHAGRETGGQP